MFKIARLGLISASLALPGGYAAAQETVVAATWLPPQHQYSRYLYT